MCTQADADQNRYPKCLLCLPPSNSKSLSKHISFSLNLKDSACSLLPDLLSIKRILSKAKLINYCYFRSPS
ncbi:hypothetical protein COCSUDRAFT_34135 [Coccomyxa subellipsoidea C-169]|uniref:Uncharacterized protein n=1 Tax=Coccomyxa subellipsoidea (strain C-169) TaxID=574566 RepID=I0YNI3_COCSC|nr:hypothetical protein COCSUDRAFT_34135 [Coccomyxa subellipsoidea C-169]EIE19952.1 hypothetical protein COCSUDRAFT_34135 [Coccomyxa subellipsoidea C-169]|eukprot:XP_005644496.1 hypothetical protein COCSUDRAFT_34135 [Coccomyxa subellipsoidea C-169]